MTYDTYLAANSPSGFVSRFDQLDRAHLDRLYILKGTSGNGKSTFLRQIAKAFADDPEVELIHCSADPSSLDGVLLPARRVALVDGTPPHTLEPRSPLAFERVVSLYEALDGEAVYARREEVFAAQESHRALMERASRLIAAAGAVDADLTRLQEACLDRQKLNAAAARLSRRLFGRPKGVPGREQLRFLSAVGGETYLSAITARCSTLFQLDDEAGAARLYLSLLRSAGRAAGYACVTFLCPMRPGDRVEHLCFPELGLGFVTSNAAHAFDLPEAKHIRCRRFTDPLLLRQTASRRTADRRMERALLKDAASTLQEAKSVHDTIEGVYVDALDREMLNEKAQQIMDEIRRGTV